MKIVQKIKKLDLKYFHILIIVLGIIFISLSIFHTNMWFDEAYTVGIVRHSFSEIWDIGKNDVHPIFYYYCLHILYLIFGQNLIVYRIFSCLAIAILGIMGYTHIRKDFGEKTGLLFSFLILFLPVSATFAGEIRMYSFGMLLGTIMAIYAYRIYKGNIHKATYIIFALSSLFVAHTHYYGLLLAALVNVMLFIYLVRNRKERASDLKKFIVAAVFQVALYLPWLIAFARQLKPGGFWITLTFPGTIYEILTMQSRGNLSFQPIILSTAFYAYIVYLVCKTPKEERKPATICFGIYIGIILMALFVSVVLQKVILLYRYLIIVNGIFTFAIAFFMAKDTKKWRVAIICILILILSIYSNIIAIRENYNENNREFMEYIDKNMQEGDIIVYSNAISGEVITTEVAKEHDNMSYFYNKENWGVQEAYKAFGPNMEIKNTLEEILDNSHGRAWIIEGGNSHELFEEISEKYEVTKLDERQFENKYKGYQYTFELINY